MLYHQYFSKVFFLLVIISFFGCNDSLFDNRISEGVIEFKVTYPDLDPDNLLATIMPDVMSMKFKDNVFNSELSAGMGMFKANLIANSNAYTLTKAVKLGNNKYVSRLSKTETQEYNESYDNVSVINLNETQEIAGLKCKKALLIFENIDMDDIYVYYTDKIKFKDPNWSTPFKDIDGVLLAYEVEQLGIKMKFVAYSISEQKIDESDLLISEDYESISIDKLDEEVELIFNDFN